LVTIEVRGAHSEREANRIARQIANSPLVKTAFFGCDPNVGRIVAAAGAAGVKIDPDRLELSIDAIRIGARGTIILEALARAKEAMRKREYSVRLDLKLGHASARVLTSDLSHGYISINAEYTT